jgi:hypothetical protein
MSDIGWSVVDVFSRFLENDEREAVRGDLAEAGEDAWHGFVDVLGLIVRRQAALWKSWQPWLAAFGLALPASFLLMGFSVSVSRCYQRAMSAGPELWMLAGYVPLLIGWSWTGGFVVGWLSRRTLWVSGLATCLACVFCLERFRQASLSRLCLLPFVLPAALGVWRGLRTVRIHPGWAVTLAAVVTALAIGMGSSGAWLSNFALTWPAWYIVATGRIRSSS